MTTPNISLYIKRAETQHTEKYIRGAFEKTQYGIVKDVTFIKKTSETGKEYNGVIVTFEKWFLTNKVKTLFDELTNSANGTAKIIHESYHNKFWFVNEHKGKVVELEKEKEEEIPLLVRDETMSDSEYIQGLQSMIKSMKAEMHFMELRQEKTERQLMTSEHRNTQQHLYNIELSYQVEEKERENKFLEEELQESLDENVVLKSRMNYLSREYDKKQQECLHLNRDLYDERCIMNYIEEQANEMREMLIACNEKKQTNQDTQIVVEELID
jgi:hypothetical protein